MNDRPTPRTDVFLQRHIQHNEDEMESTVEMLKQMERELAEARENLRTTQEAWVRAKAERAEAIRERDEARRTGALFQVRWNADMRAIQRWQAAHPGSELVWPDHADMVVWLMERLEVALTRGDESLEKAHKAERELAWSDAQDKRELVRQRDEACEQIKVLRSVLVNIRNRTMDATVMLHPDADAKGCVDDCLEWSESALSVVKEPNPTLP